MKPNLALAVLALAAGTASAQSFVGTLNTPSLDRWWYPFNFNAGAETTASIFAALGQAGFDDRDSQFVVAFNTADVVTPGLGPSGYSINSIHLRVTISNPPRFEYDPSFDSVRTSYDPSDPQYLADADAGKPIEVFAAGYRNGVTAANVLESTAFSTSPSFPPQERIRSVYAATLDEQGYPNADISNQVADRSEATPLATGQNASLTVGAIVPTDTEFTFSLDVNNPATRAYLARGLDAGRLLFVVSSLHPATGGPGGGTGDPAYPAFYTKENPLASVLPIEPALDLNVDTRQLIDFNGDGLFPDTADIDDLLTVFSGGECPTGTCASIDINGDGLFPDTADIDFFLCIFSGGGGGC
ncbi:MAG: hypothetical protein U0637_12365 [Phycisphaerales bacterium]